MIYSTPLIDIIKHTVLLMNMTVAIRSIQRTGNTHIIYVDDVKHAQADYEIEIGGNTYMIAAVDWPGRNITVTGTQPIIANKFQLYRPKFYHGTPVETNTELGKESVSTDKLPMFWMLETFDEDMDYNVQSDIERTSTPKIFALGQRPKDEFSCGLMVGYINPMHRMLENLVLTMQHQRNIYNTDEFKPTFTNYAKFGVYINNSGVKKSFFADSLSGVGMAGELVIRKGHGCVCLPQMNAGSTDLIGADECTVLASGDNEIISFN